MKKKLYDFVLEPLKERYTEQWERWFKASFSKYFDYVPIQGKSIKSFVDVGSFLDVNSTNFYKANQIQIISDLFDNKIIKNGDIFFVPDMWFPIEQLKYLIQLNNLDVKIYTFLHAGSYTIEDFASPLSNWAKFIEIGWASAVDGIFVGSNYSKDSFINRRLQILSDKEKDVISKKIYVTYNPFDSSELNNFERINNKKQIIFPNRFDYEKRPNIFLDLAVILKDKYPEWNFLVCTSRKTFKSNSDWLIKYAQALEKKNVIQIKYNLSKTEYYQELFNSDIMISTTIEENFGYCSLESLIANIIPLIPNDFSSPELIEDDFCLYKEYDDLLNKLELLMSNSIFLEKKKKDLKNSKIISKCDNAINEMAKIILKD